MSVVVVSPHLDDAVLSCWTVLTGKGETEVVTVFTAGPHDPTLLTGWDRLSGAPSSAVRILQRLEENRAALANAGCVSTNLGCLEGQYGGGEVDEHALAAAIKGADVVYLPAGTARHPDQVNQEHVAVREAGLMVCPDALLYADQPYNFFLAGLDLPPELRNRFGPADEAVLTEDQKTRKAYALACYAGELRALTATFGLDLTKSRNLPRETFWHPA